MTILPPQPAFSCLLSKQDFVWLLFTRCHLCFQIGHLRKETDGSLLYTVVNQLDADAEGWLSLCILFNIQSYSLCIYRSSIHSIWKTVSLFLNFAEEETHKVDLSSLSNKLLPGLTTLGFKDDRRHKGTPESAYLLCPSVHLPLTCGDHSGLFLCWLL